MLTLLVVKYIVFVLNSSFLLIFKTSEPFRNHLFVSPCSNQIANAVTNTQNYPNISYRIQTDILNMLICIYLCKYVVIERASEFMWNITVPEILKFPITSCCETTRKSQFQLYFDFISTHLHTYKYIHTCTWLYFADILNTVLGMLIRPAAYFEKKFFFVIFYNNKRKPPLL